MGWWRLTGWPRLMEEPSRAEPLARRLAVAEKKVATIGGALLAISQAHKLHGFPSRPPGKAAEVAKALQGIRIVE